MHGPLRRLTLVAVLGAVVVSPLGHAPISRASGAAFTIRAVRTRLEQVTLRRAVTVDAYVGVIYAPAAGLSTREGAARRLGHRLTSSMTALARLRLTGPTARLARSLEAADRRFAALLERVAATVALLPFSRALTAVTLAANRATAAEHRLRQSVGLTARDPWFSPHPRGEVIYSDDLLEHHAGVNWQTTSTVHYGHGGLQLDLSDAQKLTARPGTSYSFDADHVSAQVTGRPRSGDPYYGLACPTTGTSTIVATVRPAGRWTLGIDLYPFFTAVSHLISPRANTVRLDCEQFAPGLATGKLYLNGHFLGAASAALDLGPASPSLLAIGDGSRSSPVVFTNWSVARQAP